MNPRNFVELAQMGRYGASRILENLEGLRISDPYDLAKVAQRYFASLSSRGPYEVDRREVKKAAAEFHAKAGTLTTKVQNNMDMLTADVPLIRIAHTPDHFGYLGVYAQFIFQDIVADAMSAQNNIRPCQMYLNVDCDIAEDKRLRVSYFPDIERRLGSLRLECPIQPTLHQRVIKAVERPSEEVVTGWIESLRRLVAHNLTVLYRGGIPQRRRGELRARLDDIECEIRESYARSSTLGEFNTIFMSRLVNLHWQMPTVFVSTSNTAPLMQECYEHLLQQYPTVVQLSHQVIDFLQSENVYVSGNFELSIDEFPFWYICPSCFSRVRLQSVSQSSLVVDGRCSSCRSSFRANLGTFSNPDLEPIRGRIVPQVLFDELADILGWRISGGVNYLGGVDHTLVSNLVASGLGLAVPPECLWRPKGVYYGLAESRVAQSLGQRTNQNLSDKTRQAIERVFLGRGSILYYLLSQGIHGLHEMWRKHFERGAQSYEVNTGVSAFVIPDKQRLVLEDYMRKLDPQIPGH